IYLQAHEGYSYVPPNKQLSYDRGYSYEEPHDQWSNNDGIPGVAGKDYPILHRVPWTRFVCEWKYPGYYADPEADCQAYHICQRGGRKDSFLCPNGTLFNQERLVCTWWYTVDCSRAQSFYSINEAVAKAMEEADRRLGIADGQKLSWSYQRESNEERSWNKNWQSERRGWNKDSTSIRHNQDLDFPKQFLYETPARPKFFGESSQNSYKGDAFGKEFSQHRQTFYLPV
ncbi:PREDICTED: uncharacterized protein LOC105560610, partial [Vollenhovia emeryi]|uniref:uncharacterized protein LOC105560610 n=1 Tax=Vollenhovia emeryi TaxID=411798 RepID=UPI0005F3C02B